MQVGQGVSEFRPSPLENRNCFKCSYSVPHTLLVMRTQVPLELYELDGSKILLLGLD